MSHQTIISLGFLGMALLFWTLYNLSFILSEEITEQVRDMYSRGQLSVIVFLLASIAVSLIGK